MYDILIKDGNIISGAGNPWFKSDIGIKDGKIASIGPVTSRQLAELDVRVDLEAAEHTIDGMLDAIESTESGNL